MAITFRVDDVVQATDLPRTQTLAEHLGGVLAFGGDGDKRVQHIEDARRLGVEVKPPDINTSNVEFTVASGRILFGLTAIKGVGRGAAQEIVRERTARGPYRDLFDLCDRVDLKLVPRAAISSVTPSP